MEDTVGELGTWMASGDGGEDPGGHLHPAIYSGRRAGDCVPGTARFLGRI